MLSSHALCSANVTEVEIVEINEKKVAAAQYLELEDSVHSDENAENLNTVGCYQSDDLIYVKCTMNLR